MPVKPCRYTQGIVFAYGDVESGKDDLSENSYAKRRSPTKRNCPEDEPLVLDSSSETNRMKRQRITHESSNIKHYDNNERDSSTTVDQVKIESICNAIWPGMLLTISDGVGYEKIMEGHPGIVLDVDRRKYDNFGNFQTRNFVTEVKLGTIDMLTGIETSRWYPINRLRRPVELFGSILRGKSTLQMKIFTCTSSPFAREALLSMMLDFDGGMTRDLRKNLLQNM